MSPLFCHRLELPLSSTYGAGAAVLMATLVDQTSLPWPDEFPRKIEREKSRIRRNGLRPDKGHQLRGKDRLLNA
jgi:hypothetical protein